MSNIRHAWYSEYQEKVAGVCIWETANGQRVKCTMITTDKSTAFCPNITDFQYLGEVVRCVETLMGGLAPLDLEIMSSERRVAVAKERIAQCEKLLGITPKKRFVNMNDITWGMHKPKTWNVN